MKIKPEHYECIAAKIADEMKSLGITLQTIHMTENPKRYAYRVYMSVIPAKWVCDNLYPYCNDDHIDTAIRKIFQLGK